MKSSLSDNPPTLLHNDLPRMLHCISQIFETYSSFEEGLIQQRMEAIQAGDEDQFPTQDEAETDLELKLARYEWLMDRRPLLLNSVLLRQNPHNVNEWHKRVELLKGHPKVNSN